MNNLVRRTGLLLALLAVGCTTDPFCLKCLDGSVDPGDGAPDACVPDSVEVCNGRDDNCDGFVDEGLHLDSDPFNFGG